MPESRDFKQMGLFRKPMKWMFSAGAMVLLAAALWPASNGWSPQGARDFEECMQYVRAKQLADDERSAEMTACNASFAGRRKAGGGYAYYDFMQDRTFDIAGPNPTAEEAKRIDLEYVAFLRAQRGTPLLLELPKMQLERFQTDPEQTRKPAGPPIVLTPRKSSPPVAKRQAERARATTCDDGSLSCTWEKLSANVRAAFAASKGPP
jgi:hypothetical protein